MELLMLLIILLALGIAAQRWGFDSRDGVDSPEWKRRWEWGSIL